MVPGRPTGRGVPAVYETTLRPDAVHTSYVVGVAWMDTTLLDATLYSGSQIPGGGPYAHTAPIARAATTPGGRLQRRIPDVRRQWRLLHRRQDVIPLRTGAASFVIYKNGTSTVGMWGRDVTMTPDVVSVRQNLDLVVDNGRPVPGLNATTPASGGPH